MKPSLKAHLERLSELTGNSQGSLVSDLLEGSEQVFERLIVVLEAAKVARENISRRRNMSAYASLSAEGRKTKADDA